MSAPLLAAAPPLRSMRENAAGAALASGSLVSCGARLGMVLALSLLLLGNASAAPKSDDTLRLRLEKMAQDAGQVRIIVRLDLGFDFVDLKSPDKSARQAEIASVQQAVLDGLRGTDKAAAVGARVYKFVPDMALTVNPSGLRALYADPRIGHVWEDVADEPALQDTVSLIGATSAWSGEYIGTGYTIAVLDTGAGPHPFLDSRIVSEACYSTGDVSLCPGGVTSSTAPGSGADCATSINGCGHGTHVAGIAAGQNGLSGNLQGVAFDSNIISIKIFSRYNSGCDDGAPCARTEVSDQISGLQRVMELSDEFNIAAVNMSIGGGFSTTTCDTDSRKAHIDALISANIATVIAAGNDRAENGDGGTSFPGCISSAITVGATTKDDELASYSHNASFVDLLAPGSDICSSTMPGVSDPTCGASNYRRYSGTSMAAPHVAGAWALMRSRQHNASVADIRALLRSTGTGISTPSGTLPRIRVGQAVQALSEDNPLLSDVPLRHLAWQTSVTQKMRYFYIDVPAGRPLLYVRTEGGTGNANFYVRLGSKPTTATYACRSTSFDNWGSCFINNPAAGRWWIGILPAVGYDGLDLVASYTRTPLSVAVRSSGEVGVPITVVSGPGSAGGITPYSTGTLLAGTNLTLSAPLSAPSDHYYFSRWIGCDSVSAVGNSWCHLTVNANREVEAVFAPIQRYLEVRSGNIIGVQILGSPGNMSGETRSGIHPWYSRTTNDDQAISLTAPATVYAATFTSWSSCNSVSGPGNRTCNLVMDQNKVVTANYANQNFNVNFSSSGAAAVSIDTSSGPATTPFTFSRPSGDSVGGIAPAVAGGLPFSGWTGCDAPSGTGISPPVTPDIRVPTDCQVVVDGTRNLQARYAAGDPVDGFRDDFDHSRWTPTINTPGCGTATVDTTASSLVLTTSYTGAACGLVAATYTHAGAGESGLLTFDYTVTPTSAHNWVAEVGILGTGLRRLAERYDAAGQVALPLNPGERVVIRLLRYSGSSTATMVVSNLQFRRNLPPTVPAAPLIGTALRGDGEIVVPFTPASNGGSAVLDYTATCGAVSQSGTTSPIVVTGLVNGVSYTCSVVARNVHGTGAPSAPSNSVIPGGVPQAPLMGVATPVRAGGGHSCALDRLGAVYCWGRNSDGQLGDGTLVNRSTPVAVVGLGSGVRAIATGGNHSCALTAGSGVVCWGRNEFGQLGDNSTTNRPTPVAVAGLASGMIGLTTAANHSCALTAVGGVKCWGRNSTGQLGDNSTTQRPAPVDVVGLASGIAEVAAGDHHSCARGIGGDVRCWGWNVFGQLGDGSNSDRLTPVAVASLGNTTALGAGTFHSCAMRTNGTTACWGRNDFGQLGDGTQSNRNAPVDVVGLSDAATAIGGGSSHTCALFVTGVKCWGLNASGQLGDGTLVQRSIPGASIAQTSGALALGAGASHNCALGADGELLCWGGNGQGQLGDGSTDNRLQPVQVQNLLVPAAVAGDASISVVFTPRSAGASPVIDYTVSCGAVSAVGTASPIVVTGLVNGTAYTCSVVARSALGSSLPSPPSNSVTPKAPSSTSISGPAASAAATAVTFTATVGGASAGGSVGFLDGASAIAGCGAIALVAGQAQCTTDTLSVGAHSIVAAYSGDPASLPSQSSGLAHTVSVAVPAAPSSAVATPGNAQISVAFVAGGSGGSPILDYTATCGGSSQAGSASPVVVGGLVNGTAYTCTVTARNAVGSGPASAPSNSATPATVPGAPAMVSASAGDGSVSVSFAPPASNGGSAVIDYTATCGAHSSSDPVSPISVTGLANGTAVTCTVVANNAIGSGVPSAPSNSVTPRALTSTVLSGPPTSDFGSAVQLNATVTGSDNAGSVAFKDGAQTLAGCAAVALTAGVATCSTSALTVGAHTLTAEYSGDAAHAPSLSSPLAHTVAAVVPAAPGNVVATPGNASASVAFTAPASNGGSAIVGYTANCTPGPASNSGATSPLQVGGLANGQIYHCSVLASNAVGNGPASASVAVIPAASTNADLSITKSNGVAYVSGGLPTTYQILVSNPGPAGVASARVTDTLDPVFSLATWTCSGQGGAQCAAGGNGNLDTLVHLPPASSVNIQLTATVAPQPETPVSNIAAVTPPAGIVDANLGNNVATDGPDVVGVFRSGFE